MSYYAPCFILLCGNVVDDENIRIEMKDTLLRMKKLVSSQRWEFYTQNFDFLTNNKHTINIGLTT